MNNDKVTIIVPVYNTEHLVECAVMSLINQTYKNIEIIAIDDGSTDNSLKTLNYMASKDNRITVVSKKNDGAASARNYGISFASGKYITFLDSDDFLVTNAIEYLVNKISQSNNDAVYPSIYNEINNNEIKPRILLDKNDRITDPYLFSINTLIKKARGWRTSSVIYKLDIILENGIRYPEGQIAEDYLFNLLYLKNSNKIEFIEYATLNVLIRKDSVTKTYNSKYEESQRKVIENTIYYLNSLGKSKEVIIQTTSPLLLRNFIINIKRYVLEFNTNSLKKQKDYIKSTIIKNKELAFSINSVRYNQMNFFIDREKNLFVKMILFLLKFKLYGTIVIIIRTFRMRLKKV